MSQEQELWRLEEQFWVGDAAFYERTLAPEAFMVLPAPAGVLDRAATIESIRSASRWQNVSFRQKHYAASAADIVVLAYAVQADRGSKDSTYAAQCSSTYVRASGSWQLALHHQTPAGQANGGRPYPFIQAEPVSSLRSKCVAGVVVLASGQRVAGRLNSSVRCRGKLCRLS